MASYPFVNLRTGKVVYKKYRMENVPAIGEERQMGRDIFRRLSCADVAEGAPGGHLPGAWPMCMNSLSVPKHQVASMREHLRKTCGYVPNYDANGKLWVSDRKDRARAIRAMRGFDRDAGYGDPSPNT